MRLERGIAFPDADRLMAAQMSADQTYQGAHVVEALRLVTDFSCALDGGAHVGLWSRQMAGQFLRVLAVEPSPDTFECLVENTKQYPQITCVHAALSDASGRVSMTWSAQCRETANTGGRFMCAGDEIAAITIDSLQLPTLGFLKLDVEGAEPAALLGAAETIARCRPLVLFENKWHWSHNFGLPKNAVRDLLLGHGYRLLSQIGHDQIWGPL